MRRQPVQVVHVREQGSPEVSELRTGAVHKRVTDPVYLFQASLVQALPADAQMRRTMYVPTIRIMSGRSRSISRPR
jgi:hypothetical protein